MRNIYTKVGLFLGLIALLWSAPALAQPARVQVISPVDDTSGSNITSLPSGTFTPTAGNTLVFWWGYYRNGGGLLTITMTDTAGNSFNCTSIAKTDVGAGGTFSATGGGCYAHNIGGTLTNDVVTMHLSGSGDPFVEFGGFEYSATGTGDPLDTSVVGTTSAGASVTTAAFTTTTANEVLSCGLLAQNTQTWVAGVLGSGSVNGTLGWNGSGSNGLGSMDRAVSAIQTGQTGTATIGGSTDLAIICATFTAGGGTPPRPACTRMLLGVGCVAPPPPPAESTSKRRD